MSELPSGTVTFLFTDIEGSTTRWEQHRDAMQVALARHDAILREAIEAHGGVVFKPWETRSMPPSPRLRTPWLPPSLPSTRSTVKHGTLALARCASGWRCTPG